VLTDGYELVASVSVGIALTELAIWLLSVE